MFLGVILAALILFLPIFLVTCESSGYDGWETIPLAFLNMIKLFVIDADLKEAFDLVDLDVMGRLYRIAFSILFIVAPVLTFGFVLTFFKNVWAYLSYVFHLNSNVIVFSELNEKSLALLRSLQKNKRHIT